MAIKAHKDLRMVSSVPRIRPVSDPPEQTGFVVPGQFTFARWLCGNFGASGD
jgi:hypothetical protein